MNEPPLRDTFGKFLVKSGAKNQKIVVLDADLSSSTRTSEFAKTYPDRFFNMGIAEQNQLGTAIGLAISNKIPIVSGFSIFTTGRAWDFIRLACHDNLNLKIITTHGGFVGEDGSTHHSLGDLSLMGTIPNLTILIPSDNIELIQILEYALNIDGPFYIRLPRGSFPKIHNEKYIFSINKPEVLKQGKDICLIGTGYGSVLALQTAQSIEKKLQISIKVINLPCIKPINQKLLLNELHSLKGIVVIEEHNTFCGFGSIISRIISENYPLPMRFIGVDSFGESGSIENLLQSYGFNQKNITEQISKILNIHKS